MSYTSTTKLGLFKPVPGTAEPFRASDFNDNMDKIDAEAVAIDVRIDAHDVTLADHDGRLDTIESLNTAQDGRLTALEGVDNDYDGRLDTLEAYDITLDGRLDTLEGLNISTRLTAGETKDTTQDNRLAVLEIAAGNPPLDFSVDGGTP